MKSSKKSVFCFTDFITDIASAYLFTVSVLIMIFPQAGVDVKFANNLSLFFFAVIFIAFAALITLLDIKGKYKDISRYLLMFSIIVFAFSLVTKTQNFIVYAVLFIVLMISMYCFDKKADPKFLHNEISRRSSLSLVISASVVAFIILCTISVLRYYTYSAPNYDFGLFCNMFYNMKETGKALSTSERDKLLSHFAVHISPIFYLLLPIYYVFPSPVTLAVLQPLIVFSAVIPFYLLSKHFGLSRNCVTFFTMVFASYTALSSGCFYDLHENCFLPALLLWMFYFFEKDKKIPMFIFMLLVLTVKEDAFIYIVFFALYIFINRKKYATASIMTASALIYFVIACAILTQYGTGVMSSRYSNLSGGGGLIESAKTILINPGYAISQVLATKNNSMDKIIYIAELFCPLAFIPFMNKEFSRYILILPIFINLLTQYQYQYDINFQYTFGICAFLFYLSLHNLSDMKKEKQEHISFAALIASLLLFCSVVLPKCDSYITKMAAGSETYLQITEALETIPDNAEVTASTYFIAHIANRDVIYEDEYHDTPSTEYFVLDRTRAAAEGREKMYVDNGYKLVYEVEGVIEIYRNEAYINR